jgi:hypothetical protein
LKTSVRERNANDGTVLRKSAYLSAEAHMDTRGGRDSLPPMRTAGEKDDSGTTLPPPESIVLFTSNKDKQKSANKTQKNTVENVFSTFLNIFFDFCIRREQLSVLNPYLFNIMHERCFGKKTTLDINNLTVILIENPITMQYITPMTETINTVTDSAAVSLFI